MKDVDSLPNLTMERMGSKEPASWRVDVPHVTEGLGFEKCCPNNDVWYRTTVNNKGKDATECVLACTDDLLVRALDPGQILSHIEQHLKWKDGSILGIEIVD